MTITYSMILMMLYNAYPKFTNTIFYLDCGSHFFSKIGGEKEVISFFCKWIVEQRQKDNKG